MKEKKNLLSLLFGSNVTWKSFFSSDRKLKCDFLFSFDFENYLKAVKRQLMSGIKFQAVNMSTFSEEGRGGGGQSLRGFQATYVVVIWPNFRITKKVFFAQMQKKSTTK